MNINRDRENNDGICESFFFRYLNIEVVEVYMYIFIVFTLFYILEIEFLQIKDKVEGEKYVIQKL